MQRKVTADRHVNWNVQNIDEEFINNLRNDDFKSDFFEIVIGSKIFVFQLCMTSSDWHQELIKISLLNWSFTKFDGFVTISIVDNDLEVVKNNPRVHMKNNKTSLAIGRQEFASILEGHTTLHVVCQIEISVFRKSLIKELKLASSDEKIVRIFEESLFCDFKIETKDGEVLSAHKSFLTVHSPVFEAMLKQDTEESQTNHVKVEDINGKTMKEMLRFIYTGNIEDEKEVARELLTAAVKYQIETLKIRCCDILEKEVTVENAVELILIADQVQNDELFQQCLDFIASDFARISNSDDWKKIEPKLMTKMMKELIGSFEEIVL